MKSQRVSAINDLDNEAPIISGAPDMVVSAGRAYFFRPDATDGDGTALSFGIRNRPGWADFNSANGQLSGIPVEGDVGRYENILISVTDGRSSAELKSFGITVLPGRNRGFTVLWKGPTKDTNGCTLTNLAGYRLYLGSRPGAYTTVVDINEPTRTAFSFEEMPAGTYFVAITAVNDLGHESRFSREVSVQL